MPAGRGDSRPVPPKAGGGVADNRAGFPFPLPETDQPMHILIADADPGTRLVVAAAVERLGHECTVAENGAQAWAGFGDVAPDVVITDWDMPEMDGTELTRRIRARADVPYPYVIVLTARADQ